MTQVAATGQAVFRVRLHALPVGRVADGRLAEVHIDAAVTGDADGIHHWPGQVARSVQVEPQSVPTGSGAHAPVLWSHVCAETAKDLIQAGVAYAIDAGGAEVAAFAVVGTEAESGVSTQAPAGRVADSVVANLRGLRTDRGSAARTGATLASGTLDAAICVGASGAVGQIREGRRAHARVAAAAPIGMDLAVGVAHAGDETEAGAQVVDAAAYRVAVAVGTD